MSFTASSEDSQDYLIEKISDRTEKPLIRWSVRTVACSITSFAVIIFISLFGIMSYQWSQYIHSIDDCGVSPAEARHRGCIFDAMEFAWLPRECFDHELQKRFLSLREWVWYLDQAGTVPADEQLVLSGLYEELYATQEYHVFHCTYMWRKIHQAVLDGTLVDGYIGDMHHTAHCERQITRFWDSDLNDTSTSIYVKFANCPKELYGLGRLGWYRVINGKKVYRDP